MLYTPGTRADRIEKAAASGAADIIVADLEDAVAPDEKEAARSSVREAITAARSARSPESTRPELCVRINAWRGGLATADLEAVMPARPDLIVLPKAGPLADLTALDVTLDRLERTHAIPRGTTGIVAIVESTEGVFQAPHIARASTRLVALAFGAEDLAADARLRRTAANEEVHMARSRVALAAARAGLDALDQVFVDIEDVQGLTEESLVGRSLGYAGKMVIHPRQIEPVHRAFSPTDADIEQARELVSAVGDEDVGEGGVLRFKGRMIDVPLIEQARRVLAEAHAAGRL